MRRFVTLSLSVLLGLSSAEVFAQDEKKPEAAPAAAPAPAPEAAPAPAPAPEAAPAPAPAPEAAPAPAPSVAEEKPIPPEVQAKLDAARKAVAEAIVAAENAGLVDSSIDPPPILDILLTGRANDGALLKAKTDASPEVGVSPEVFGAWFTGFKKDGFDASVTAEKNVRIVPPSKGLTEWYSTRASIFRPLLEEARKAAAPAPATEAPKPEEKPADAPKPEEAAPADAPKPEEAKPADAPKPEEAKPADAPKPEEAAPADAPKPEEAKPADAPKPEEAAPADAPKPEEKPEEPKGV